jgi:hypothetical protein
MVTLALNDYSVMELSNDESILIIGGGFWRTFGLICGAIACVALIGFVAAGVVLAAAIAK